MPSINRRESSLLPEKQALTGTDEWSTGRYFVARKLPNVREAGSEEKLYVKFTIERWMKRDKTIVSGGRGIYTALYTSKYIFDRVAEIAELKLETEEDLIKWREQRRAGTVRVELDHEQVDLAKRVLGIHRNQAID